MEKQPLINNFPTYLKFICLGFIIIIVLLFTLLIGMLAAIPFFGPDLLNNLSGISNISDANVISAAKYFQILSELGMFIFPAIIFAFLVNRNIPDYLSINIKPKLTSLIITGIIIIIAVPFINWMVELNETLKLPESFAGIENWMKNSEQQATRLTEAFLNVQTISGLAINLLMVSILTPIGEEFLFRGVLLRLFNDWTKNIHVAILISAILFSAMHLQFYGFFPRMMIGVLFGYIFIWTKSIWIPIFAHFVNNTGAVITAYLNNKGVAKVDLDTLGTQSSDIIYLLGSIVLTSLLIISIYLIEKKKKNTLVNF